MAILQREQFAIFTREQFEFYYFTAVARYIGTYIYTHRIIFGGRKTNFCWKQHFPNYIQQ